MEPDHIAALHRTSRIVSSSMTLREMLQELVDLVVEATGCDACLAYLPDPATGTWCWRRRNCRTRPRSARYVSRKARA